MEQLEDDGLTQSPEFCLFYVTVLSALGQQLVGNHVWGTWFATTGTKVESARFGVRHYTIWC